MINGVTELSMMKADVLDQFDKIKVALPLHKGEKIDYFPYGINNDAKPVYIEMEGWNTDLLK